MKINEVDPRNYDSDIDYYAALKAKPKQAQEPDDLPEPPLTRAQQDAEDEDRISQQRQRADAKFRQKRKVEYVDQEGSAPNGKKHNKLYVIDAQDEAVAHHEEYLFDKHEWGAKKVVDTKLEKNPDGTVRLTLYIVDNHKYGFWRPWKDSPVRKESAELEEKAPPGMEDWINSRKADFKKRYGDKWQQVLYATAWKRHNNESVAKGLNEFAPPGSNDGGDDGFSEETLKRLASQWYNGDEDPRVERTLMAAGWEIGQDEGYDDEPGVFVVQSGDVNGNSYISWPAHELKQGVAEGEDIDARISNLKDAIRFETPRSVPGEDHREQYARHAEKIAGYKAELKKLVAQKKQGVDEADMSRRGFLKGLGAGAAAVAGAGLPTLAQAKGPGYWANYAGKALADATGGLKIRLRSADIEISTGESVSPMEYMATNVYDLVTKYCELTDCYNAKQAIDNATKEAIKISKIDNFVYRPGSEKQFVLAYRASLNDEIYEWKKGGKPAQPQQRSAPKQEQPPQQPPQEIKLNLKPNRQVGDIITVKGGVADGKKAKVTQILGPNKDGTGNKGLGVIVESVNQGVAKGLNEFAPAGGGGNIPRGPKTPKRDPWGDNGEDPYQLRRYNRSADFFDQFDSDGVDKQKFDKKTGEYEGYYFDRDAASGITQIAYFKFDDPTKIDDNDPGVGWYYEPIDEGVAEGEDIDARIANLKDAIRFETPRSIPGEHTEEQYIRHAKKIADYKAELKKLIAQKKQGVTEGKVDIKLDSSVKAIRAMLYNWDEEYDVQKFLDWARDSGADTIKNAIRLGTKANWRDPSMERMYPGAEDGWERLSDIVQYNPYTDKGVAEGYDNVGNKIKALYQKIYDQGDDSIDYMYHESPVFAQIWDEYEGDLDSIIAEVDPSELQVIANELEAYLQGPGLTEATNPEDVICLDVPLFIRLMEYAREDASSDMDLHDVAERLIKLSASGKTVSMSSYDEIVGAQTKIKEAGMDLEQGRKNIISILKASEQGQDAEIMVGGEPITLEYPEARFVGGRYKAFLKAGRQEEFLRALTNPQAFDRIMAKLRTMINKQKNFRGSVPGERGVEEGSFHNPGQQDSPVAGAITRRILMQRTDLLAKHGPVKVGQAIDSVADFVGDVDEIGSSDVSGWVKQVERELGGVAETQVNEAGDVKGAVLDCFKQILAGAQAGDDMIDYLADELNDYYKPVRASRDPQLQKAYQHMMDNGQEAEGDPQAMAQVAQQAISMLSSVPEAAPGLVKAAAGLAVGGIAAAGAPAIVGILGPLLGIPMAAYGAYSAAKLGMQGVEKLWDMAAEKLGGDDKVAQYTNAKIAELPPEQKQAAAKVVKAVSESRQRKNPALAENQYWCNLDKQIKLIPEGYKKNKDGYLVRK